MNSITEKLLEVVSDYKGEFKGAYNIREDSQCAGRRSSEHVKIEDKQDGPGLVIRIDSEAQGETVFIPACVTKGNVDDLVYNDFYVEAGADVIIVAGCGVHTNDGHDARHSGIHRFFLGENSHVLYKEKHLGTGKGFGKKKIDPVTDIRLEAGAVMEMDTVQIGGVDTSIRKTNAVVGKDAKLIIHERLMTDEDERAESDFFVVMEGDGSAVDLNSRSVAKGQSYQSYRSRIEGNCACTGHSACDAILIGNGKVNAVPELFAGHLDASLIHEAAIGKIAGEQLIKLQTLGLTAQEAEEKIVEGFLK